MKKVILFSIGLVAGIVAVANMGALIGLAISAVIAYAGMHYYRKSDHTLLKIFWGGVLIIGVLTAISNIPAFVAIVAAIGLYAIWKAWKNEDVADDTIIEHKPSDDPFVNFEKQWDALNKNN
ncbi:MAG TPA: ABC transporter permease [Sporosarcina sp.]|nr:ABC transporter permease [Sporosarcina sp.]